MPAVKMQYRAARCRACEKSLAGETPAVETAPKGLRAAKPACAEPFLLFQFPHFRNFRNFLTLRYFSQFSNPDTSDH